MGEDMVQMGVGWLLKEQSAHYPDEVVDYLKSWTASTSRLVLRYASEKLPPERRREVFGLSAGGGGAVLSAGSGGQTRPVR